MTRRPRLEDLYLLAVPSRPVLSPDGTRVVYVVRTLDAETDRAVDRLWTVSVAGGDARPLSDGPADTSPAWSPDGSRVAFLREGRVQVLTPGVDGEQVRQVADLPGATAPVWSPDGRRLATTAPVDPGEGEDPLVTRRLDYQTDGDGLVGAVRHQVHVVDLDTGRVRQVTDGPEDAASPAWSPDGGRLAFVRGVGDAPDVTLRSAAHVVAVDEPGAPRVVGSVDGTVSAVSFTADGTGLLVVGRPSGSVGHEHLVRVALHGDTRARLTASVDRNVMPGGPAYPGGRPHELADGRVLVCLRDRGCTHLWVVAEDEPAVPVLAGEGRVVSGLSVVGRTAVVVLGTPSSYGEVVALDLDSGTETVLTDHGAPLADVELVEPEPRTFTTGDGTEVQGWLLRDPDREGPLPLLLDVHGGPHNAWNAAADEMHFYHQELVARGWAVLLVNPRGSDGYGEEFMTGVCGGWGTADAADLLEPLDTLVAEGVADPGRLAVTGYSYGGFMTCWLTGHDDRFVAAVGGGVVSDLVSMVGTCATDPCSSAEELGGTPWDQPERFAAMSPVTAVGQVRTPTLLLHGANDRTCPVGQAQQWQTALRTRGVPTELVLYPGAAHAFVLLGRPSHRLDYSRRVVDWVERHALHGGRPALDGAHWERRLAALARRHGVPGAALGVLRLTPDGDDEVVVAAHGELSTATGHPVVDESVFQIGSVSKVWTATVVMQLVDEGLVTLDTPVADVVPGFRLADPEVTRTVTVRHLLDHTSGIDGDVFTDTGRGDDCLERYVELLAEQNQNHPLGATWSYCNAGYSLLGRVVECLTGTTWDAAMRERLFTPLGMAHTLTLPEEALLHSAAVGHVTQDGTTTTAPVWQLPRSLGPAGLVVSDAAGVLAFARLHLTGGLAPDGGRLLSEESAAAMVAHQADLPDTLSLGDSWGLGWIRFGWDGQRLYGHDGNTIGQTAFLRVVPDAGVAVTLLTNSDHGRDLYEDLFRELLAEVAGVSMPARLSPPDVPGTDAAAAVAPYVGRYERAGVHIDVEHGPDGPLMRTTVVGPIAEMVPDPVEEHALVPFADGVFLTRPHGAGTWFPVTFYSLPTGEEYLHFGVRATPRVA
ncbi:serine hydrolase [Phycicoccus sp. CSK15P-2]|uniref:serine hydrolase n=1 Tax=Phycicoccus sp. CSK15P-2 TaxID=2807627 RepID=UPI00194E37C6|nr:serine hydrolase [Phycicoccus sp. CSK15P-2]MBM6404541.1 serine hydrolase [Phycicoccus sp. CSK15P-2]